METNKNTYIPFITKKTICELLVKKVCYQNIGELRVFKKDRAILNVFFRLKAIELYFKFEYNKEKPFEEYDRFMQDGTVERLYDLDDYFVFADILEDVLQDTEDYETNLVGKLSQSINTITEIATSYVDNK